MSTPANAPAAQGPEIGSDEWVAQTLKAKGVQADEAEAFSDEAGSQDDGSEATTTAAVQFDGQTGTAAPTWREAAIPADDATVPQHFRGKPVDEVWNSYRNMERAWNEQQQRMRELEARVAAKDTLKELLAEQHAAANPPTPSDPYRAAGIDLETDPVLNPTKFFPTQERLILEKAKALVAEELQKRDVEAQRQHTEQDKVNRMGAALRHIEVTRGLTEAQMKQRIPSVMMTAAESLGQDALVDPERLLAIHDSIFGTPVAPVAIPHQQQIPNPPGVKRPAAVEPAPRSNGPQLKSYEREILGQLSEEITGGYGIPIDQERLMARYAANLKRARG